MPLEGDDASRIRQEDDYVFVTLSYWLKDVRNPKP